MIGERDASALPGLETVEGLVRSVTTPEFVGMTFHEVAARSAPRTHRGAPDNGPTHDPAGRPYYEDAAGRHVDGDDPATTHRDQNGRLHDNQTGRFTDDKNPAHPPEGDRALKGDATEPALSPEAQCDLDGLARAREGFRTECDNAARTVNDLAQRHGIDGSALRSKDRRSSSPPGHGSPRPTLRD